MANPAQPRYTGFPYGLDAPGLGMIYQTNPLLLPQTAVKTIFTVTGGVIWVRAIIGHVTTAIGAVANATKFTVTPTVGGTATDICATGDLNAAAAGDILMPITSFATALSINTAGVLVAPDSGTGAPTGFMMTPGVIALNCAGSDGSVGLVSWRLLYVPMTNGFSTLAGATQAGAPASLPVVVSPLS
jgi:hypothetical protein